MSIAVSQWVDTHKVKQLYELLKFYNGKTKNWGTIPTNQERVYLTYSFECMNLYHLFQEDWDRLNTPIVEKTRKLTWRQRILKSFSFLPILADSFRFLRSDLKSLKLKPNDFTTK